MKRSSGRNSIYFGWSLHNSIACLDVNSITMTLPWWWCYWPYFYVIIPNAKRLKSQLAVSFKSLYIYDYWEFPFRPRRALSLYIYIKSIIAIASFWFSAKHRWTAITPFWLSAEDLACMLYERRKCLQTNKVILLNDSWMMIRVNS